MALCGFIKEGSCWRWQQRQQQRAATASGRHGACNGCADTAARVVWCAVCVCGRGKGGRPLTQTMAHMAHT
jgi:hypothetical protein